MIWLWIGLGLLLLLGSYLVFCSACVRGKERPWTDHEAMEKRVGRSYAALIRSGVEWIERQNPRDVYLTSADGLRLHARWIPHAHAQGTMILFHGWRSSIVGDFSPSLPEYYARGYNLLLVDQRAHNGSQGKYITLGIRESRDVPDWVALHNQTFGPYPVILGGVAEITGQCPGRDCRLRLHLPLGDHGGSGPGKGPFAGFSAAVPGQGLVPLPGEI